MLAPDEPFPVHEFTMNIEGLTVQVQIILMDASLLLWAQGSSPANGNGSEAHLDSLALAMPTRFDTYALGTTLLNPSLNAISEPVAKRLSTALKIPVFASIQAVPKEMSLSLERELIRVCREALGCHSGDGSPITLERASEASTTVLDR